MRRRSQGRRRARSGAMSTTACAEVSRPIRCASRGTRDGDIAGPSQSIVYSNAERSAATALSSGAWSVPPEGPDLDRPRLCDRVPGRDLDGLLQAGALDDVEPADRLLCRDERTVGDDCLPLADADGAGPARRSQLVAGDPAAPRL